MAGVVDSLGVQPAFTMVTLLTQTSIESLSTTKSIFALTLKYDRNCISVFLLAKEDTMYDFTSICKQFQTIRHN